jgi:hypothetical protein
VRRTLLSSGAGLAVAATLLVTLTGCKSFQDDGAAASASTSASPSTGSARTSASPRPSAADTPFCTSAAKLVADTNPSSGDTSDPDKAAAFFDQGARRLRGLTPPQEIATDWATVADGLAELGKAYAGTNLSDVQEEQQLEQTITRVQTETGAAQNRVNDYLQEHCGIDTGGGTVTSPTLSAPVLVPPGTPTG